MGVVQWGGSGGVYVSSSMDIKYADLLIFLHILL